MVISKEEAARALSEINSANKRTTSMQQYRYLSPHLILWGFIYLVANSLTQFNPSHGMLAWNTLPWLGAVGSMWIGYRSRKLRSASSTVTDAMQRQHGVRILLTMFALMAFFISAFCVLPNPDIKQANAFVSLFWGTYYMVVGIWLGWRMLVVGVLTMASILIAFFVMPEHYFLWMGLVTGSLLMLGGFWLRRI